MNEITPYAITPEKMAEIRRALEDCVRDIEAAGKLEQEAPRAHFITRAEKAGFTEAQAEFLWNELPVTGWLR
jgi:hypothetical protein